MDKKTRKAVKAIWKSGVMNNRRGRDNYPAARCDENANIRAMLNANQRNGQLGLIRDGMDCDCTRYYSERIIDGFASVAAFKRWDSERQEWLDGPESVSFVPPGHIEPQHHSKDLAMEAYENGHPHHIIDTGAFA